MTTLILSEKPTAAQRIALALSDGKVQRKQRGKAAYYELSRGSEKIFVAPAVGHLFVLAPKEKGSEYPVFDAEWTPTYAVSEQMDYAKPYLENIIFLAHQSNSFVAGTDYDLEGEVIAANLMEFACHAKKVKRMRFSTLTKIDLVNAFENLEAVNAGLVEAGRTRHYLDFFWGLSMSRALMSAIRKAGVFRVMSIGRVQGPSLALLAQREQEIASFVPVPYWQIFAFIKGIQFVHEKEKFWEKKEAENALGRTKKEGIVEKVERKRLAVLPPTPHDLTTLQIDAYHAFGVTPAQTNEIAQSLYEQAVISYPRTSSQKLPAKLGLERIIRALSKTNYSPLANELISAGRFKPREGEKEDPAHPAIYPTGEIPKKLTAQQSKLYDLIVKRFLACFAPPAKREKVTVWLKLGEEKFVASGARTVEAGWIKFFSPYARFEETVMPEFSEGEQVKAEKIDLVQKETQPPKRFTQASLVKELEAKNLGTKATRAEIIKTLFDRGYVEGKAIKTTAFGLAVYDALKHHCPDILSEELTREFEQDLEIIQEKKKTGAQVLEAAKKVLVKILNDFRKKEPEVGKELLEGLNEAQKEERSKSLGKCNLCKEGNIVIKRSAYGFFAACDKYPACKNTFPLPHNAFIEGTGKQCEKCGTPIVVVKRRGKRTFQMCLDTKCPTKKDWAKPKSSQPAPKPAKTSS